MNLNEAKTLRWSGLTVRFANQRLECALHPVGAKATAADSHQPTDNVPHHVVQESVGLDLDSDRLAFETRLRIDVERMDMADAGLTWRPQGFECLES